MNFKEYLINIKEKLLSELYDIDDLYIGLLVKVHNKYEKDLTYMGGYDWKWTDVITYELLDFITIRKIDENIYKEIYTKKVYKITSTEEIENQQIGSIYLHPYIIPYSCLEFIKEQTTSNNIIRKVKIKEINNTINKSKLKKIYKTKNLLNN